MDRVNKTADKEKKYVSYSKMEVCLIFSQAYSQ